MNTWIDIRVFVSSTFRDMQAERDVLVKRVFPALRERLAPYRIRLVEIDLRWGISDEQVRHEGALELCLDQIERCRPYFLCLLGHRYGSLPDLITAAGRRRHPWLQKWDGSATSITELEVVMGALERMDADRCLVYLRSSKGLAEAVTALPGLLLDAGVGQFVELGIEEVKSALRSAGGSPDSGEQWLERLLSGEAPSPALARALSPAMRLWLVKEKLRRAGLVRLDGYEWNLQGVKIRPSVAATMLEREHELKTFRQMAPDGIVDAASWREFSAVPAFASLAQAAAAVALSGLDHLAETIGNDLWSGIVGDPELQERFVNHGATTSTSAGPESKTRETAAMFAWLRNLFPGFDQRLRQQMGAMSAQLIEGEMERSVAFRRLVSEPLSLWKQRRDAGDTDAGAVVVDFAVERDQHERFAEQKLDQMVVRPQPEEVIRGFLSEPRGRILMLTGSAGTGKSAMVARAKFLAAQVLDSPVHFAHFAGATPASTSPYWLFRRIAEELRLLSDDQLETYGMDTRGLGAGCAAALGAAGGQRPICLFVDGLDQFEDPEGDTLLSWLPSLIPDSLRVIIATASDTASAGAPWSAALGMRPRLTLDLDSHLLSKEARHTLIKSVPSLAAKSLDSSSVDRLLRVEATANPLYLRTALEELRGFGSNGRLLERRIDSFANLPTPATLFARMIEWIAEDFRPDVVHPLLSLLSLSRHGLTEAEIVSLTSLVLPGDPQALDEARLVLSYLRPYLQWRGLMVDFHHRSLREACRLALKLEDEASACSIHLRLAEWFEGAGRRAPSPWADEGRRSLSEALHHHLRARNWAGCLRLLDDDHFIFAKGRSPWWRQLMEEWLEILQTAPDSEGQAAAVIFARQSCQQLGMSGITKRVLYGMAKQDEPRMVRLLSAMHGRSELWRRELLELSPMIIEPATLEAAEAVQLAIGRSWDGDEPFNSDHVTWTHNYSTMRNLQAAAHPVGSDLRRRFLEEGLSFVQQALEMCREMGDDVNLMLTETKLITSYHDLNRHQEAAELTKDAFRRCKNDGKVLRALPRVILSGGDSMLRVGMVDEALDLMRQGLEECERHAGAEMDMAMLSALYGQACIQAKRPGDAIDAMRKALSQADVVTSEVTRLNLFVVLVRCISEAGRTDEAREVLIQALEMPWTPVMRQHLFQSFGLQEDTRESMNAAARDLEARGLLREARKAFEDALAKFPGDEVLEGNLGSFFLNSTGELALAEAAYRRALDAAPYDAVNLTNFAIVLLLRGDRSAALEGLARALHNASSPPDIFTIRTLLALAAWEQLGGGSAERPLAAIKVLINGGLLPAPWSSAALQKHLNHSPIRAEFCDLFRALASGSIPVDNSEWDGIDTATWDAEEIKTYVAGLAETRLDCNSRD
ncbi:MAG: DUF4062 domain-containing protein [Verrucomicrobiales bacterium]|nr:DUF4062 domain-containing protein [Verrucomicrobiales bacterium]